MKYAVTAFIAAATLGSVAFAESNLPNFAAQSSVGRMPTFYSPKGVSWFLPLALRSQIDCSPASGAKRSCLLKIFNAYSDDEVASMTKFESDHRTKLLALSPLDAGIVQSVQENFADLPSAPNANILKLQTLAVNSRAPYASAAFRSDAKTITTLAGEYADGGLGTFTSEVRINMEAVGDYLAINNVDVLKSELMKRSQGLGASQLNQQIDTIASLLDVTTMNMSSAEIRSELQSEIRRRFFKYSWMSGYKLRADAVIALNGPLVLEDESAGPAVVKCVTSLVLKADAVSNTVCEAEAQ